MTNQEIINSAPTGSTHITENLIFLKSDGYGWTEIGTDRGVIINEYMSIRCLKDIKKLAERNI